MISRANGIQQRREFSRAGTETLIINTPTQGFFATGIEDRESKKLESGGGGEKDQIMRKDLITG